MIIIIGLSAVAALIIIIIGEICARRQERAAKKWRVKTGDKGPKDPKPPQVKTVGPEWQRAIEKELNEKRKPDDEHSDKS